MATKNKDGLVVRYGAEEVPEVVAAISNEYSKAIDIQLQGTLQEHALDLIIPKGTFLTRAVVMPQKHFTGDIIITLSVFKKSNNTLVGVIGENVDTAALNEGLVLTGTALDTFLTEDCYLSLSTSGDSADGLAKLRIEAVLSA